MTPNVRHTRRLAALFRVSLLPALSALALLAASALPALAGQAGNVTRIQGQARAERPGQTVALALGAPIMTGDVLATGPDARLEVDFIDGTRLTLGEDTRLSIDHYVYDPGDAALTLDLAVGVFRVVSGAIAEVNPEKFQVQTPLATIGIRGTDFWGGFLEEHELSVLLLSGSAVTVTSQKGTVVIDAAGNGVTVDPQARFLPQAKVWSEQRKAKAFSTVAFD